MKQRFKYLMAIPLALIVISSAQAHQGHEGKGIRMQLNQQSSKIERGLKSGKLSRREARTLWNEQLIIRELAWNFRQDGFMSGSERRILAKKIKRVNHKLKKFKRNDHYRHGTRHRWGYRNPDHLRYSPSRFWQ